MSVIAETGSASRRRRRADAGRSRLHPLVAAKLESLLSTRQRPAIAVVQRELGAFCAKRALVRPSRAALYAAIERLSPPSYNAAELPDSVRASLYNLDDDTRVPGDQLVFHAFNYGDTAALSFASGLPWVCLRAAHRLRGWRPKSRTLLESVLAYRRI
jgi:hypothetical protein